MPYREGRWRRYHGRRAQEQPSVYSHKCVCGKLAYTTRKVCRAAAKARQRQIPAEDVRGHLSVYPCHLDPAVWHYGHLATPIVQGEADRRELYGR